jgi:hypothetical protein
VEWAGGRFEDGARMQRARDRWRAAADVIFIAILCQVATVLCMRPSPAFSSFLSRFDVCRAVVHRGPLCSSAPVTRAGHHFLAQSGSAFRTRRKNMGTRVQGKGGGSLVQRPRTGILQFCQVRTLAWWQSVYMFLKAFIRLQHPIETQRCCNVVCQSDCT